MTSSIELRVSPRAERDIATILNYTRKTWGTGQEDTYALVIRNAFGRIQAFPKIGRRVSEHRPAVRELVLEYHTIVYRYRGDTVIHSPHREPTVKAALMLRSGIHFGINPTTVSGFPRRSQTAIGPPPRLAHA